MACLNWTGRVLRIFLHTGAPPLRPAQRRLPPLLAAPGPAALQRPFYARLTAHLAAARQQGTLATLAGELTDDDYVPFDYHLAGAAPAAIGADVQSGWPPPVPEAGCMEGEPDIELTSPHGEEVVLWDGAEEQTVAAAEKKVAFLKREGYWTLDGAEKTYSLAPKNNKGKRKREREERERLAAEAAALAPPEEKGLLVPAPPEEKKVEAPVPAPAEEEKVDAAGGTAAKEHQEVDNTGSAGTLSKKAARKKALEEKAAERRAKKALKKQARERRATESKATSITGETTGEPPGAHRYAPPGEKKVEAPVPAPAEEEKVDAAGGTPAKEVDNTADGTEAGPEGSAGTLSRKAAKKKALEEKAAKRQAKKALKKQARERRATESEATSITDEATGEPPGAHRYDRFFSDSPKATKGTPRDPRESKKHQKSFAEIPRVPGRLTLQKEKILNIQPDVPESFEAPQATNKWNLKVPDPNPEPTRLQQFIATAPRSRIQPWMIYKARMQEKFKGQAWEPPKKLSPDAQEAIRVLRRNHPEITTTMLADKFEVSGEAIRRILKSKWREREKTPEAAQEWAERWAKRGQRVWQRWEEAGVVHTKKTKKVWSLQKAKAAKEVEERVKIVKVPVIDVSSVSNRLL